MFQAAVVNQAAEEVILVAVIPTVVEAMEAVIVATVQVVITLLPSRLGRSLAHSPYWEEVPPPCITCGSTTVTAVSIA